MTPGPTRRCEQSIALFLLFIHLLAHGATGTVSRTIPNGLSTLAVPFVIGSNTVAELLPSVPEGTQFYKVLHTNQVARWTINQFQFGAWVRPDETLSPGEGAFIRNPGSAFDVTFTGGIPTGPIHPMLTGGYHLIGVPRAPDFEFSPSEGDQILLWRLREGGMGYGSGYIYFTGLGWVGDDTFGDPPAIAQDEAIIYYRSSPNAPPAPASVVFCYNYIPTAGLDSPVQTTLGCVGTNLVAQLWIRQGSELTGLGEPVPVLESGYLDPRMDLLQSVPEGATIRVRVWDARYGSYDQARSSFVLEGESSEFSIAMPQPLHPPVNLTSFIELIGPLTPFPVWQAPTNTVALLGSATQLSVPLLSPAYEFQWQRESPTEPGNPPPTTSWTNIPGATSNVLHLAAVTPSDHGRYRVIMSYGCTNRIAGPVALTVASAVLSQPRLRQDDGALVFNVTAPPGLNLELISSADFITWTGGSIYSNVPAHWSIAVSNTPPRRFFRLSVVP